MKQRIYLVLWVVCGLGCLNGCFFKPKTVNPMPMSVEGLNQGTKRLMLLFPGMGDRLGRFEEAGFQAMAKKYPTVMADVAIVELDAHFGYYPSGELAGRIKADVLDKYPDYKVTVVGTSLGGFGAQLIARNFPNRVDQMVLIAPYMGGRSVIKRIATQGTAIQPGDSERKKQTLSNWQYLFEVLENKSVDVSFLVGASDRLRRGLEVVEKQAPTVNIIELPGGHKWHVWMALWEAWLQQKQGSR